MKRYNGKFAWMLISILATYNIGYTQSSYKIQETKDVAMKLMGTSSLHAWEMDAYTTTGEAQFLFESANTKDLTSIKSLSFALEVMDLKSESTGMNNNAYEALKSNEFDQITYLLTSTQLESDKTGYMLNTRGQLTIAGITKDINMQVHAVVNQDGTITCKGSYQLNMSDYEIEPPSFMWGAMKTGDEITLDFAVVYKKV